jgi:hypothetical protein
VIVSFALATLALAVAGAPPPAAFAAPRAGWYDVRSFGARGDGVADDSAAFQAALDAARTAGGGVVLVPAGTYVVSPPASKDRRTPTLRSLTIGSNVWLRGDGPASVLKVKAGVGSYRALFSNHPTASSEVENVVISDLRVDQNCGASGGDVRPLGEDRNSAMVYLAYGGKNLTVERVRFDPVCGVNTVTLNAPTARNLVVRDNYFRFVKGPSSERSYDSTAVYLHGKGMAAVGNVFESTAVDAARGAIELHGANGLAADNVSRGYRSCVRVVGTSEPGEAPPAVNGFTVTGNVCSDANDAINVWSVTGHHVRGVTIVGNTVGLAQLEHLAGDPTQQSFSGISFVWDAVTGKLDGDITDVVVAGNTISAQRSSGVWRESAYSTGGIVLTSTGNIANVVVRGNVLRDIPTKGIWVQSLGKGTKARNVRIEGNSLLDAGNDPAAGVHRAGIVVAGLLEDVEVAHNVIAATTVPFRGLFGVLVSALSGSERVGVHDNVSSSADASASYVSRFEGPVDTGVDGRARTAVVSPRPGEVLALTADGVRIWDVTVQGSNAFTVRAPAGAPRGQRLTVRIRNAQAGPLGPVRWEGFKMGAWTNPAPGHHRVVEALWDGSSWSELFQSPHDVPN